MASENIYGYRGQFLKGLSKVYLYPILVLVSIGPGVNAGASLVVKHQCTDAGHISFTRGGRVRLKFGQKFFRIETVSKNSIALEYVICHLKIEP